MNAIPVPELFAVLVIAGTIYGLRALWMLVSRPFTDGPGTRTATRFEMYVENERKRAHLVVTCVMLVVISIPLILRAVPPNGLYGFRTAATQSSSTIWYSANAFLGYALSASSVFSVIALMLLPSRTKQWVQWAVFFGPLAVAVTASFVYLSRLT